MKEYNLVIEEFNRDNKSNILKLVRKILENDIEHINITWKYYQTALKRETLHCIADLFYQLGKEKEFYVFNKIETNQIHALAGLKRVINRYGMHIVIRIDENTSVVDVKRLKKKILIDALALPKSGYKEYRNYYKKFRDCNIEMLIDENELTLEEFEQWYSDWQNDREACWISCFHDICFLVLVGVHMYDCRHNSCMGKNLCVDKKGKVYFCTEKKDGSYMYTLNKKLTKLYNEKYFYILKNANIRRKVCRESCNEFYICRGGCSLTVQRECDNELYTKKVLLIQKSIMKHKKSQFAEMKNPLLRQMMLSLVAYGALIE